MNAFVLLMLAQVVSPTVPVKPEAQLTYGDGHRRLPLYESPTLVAERMPTEATRAAVLKADAHATIRLQTKTMRIWVVSDSKAVQKTVSTLLPVLFDVPSFVGRFRVPLSLVCGSDELNVGWNEVLSRSGTAGCLPNFWYPSHPK